MRRVSVLACVVCLFWIGALPAWAAEKQKESTGTSKHGRTVKVSRPEKAIALLDINALFKSDPDFSKAMQEIKADETRAEIDMKNAGTKLKADEEEMEKLPAGSPQRSTRESQIIRRKVELQVHIQSLRDQFMQRESKLYSEYYQKIHGVVDRYAKAHKLTVVVNYNSNLGNSTKAADVVREVNQPIIWHTEGIDITPAISKELAQGRTKEGSPAPVTPTDSPEYPEPAPPVPAPAGSPAGPASTSTPSRYDQYYPVPVSPPGGSYQAPAGPYAPPPGNGPPSTTAPGYPPSPPPTTAPPATSPTTYPTATAPAPVTPAKASRPGKASEENVDEEEDDDANPFPAAKTPAPQKGASPKAEKPQGTKPAEKKPEYKSAAATTAAPAKAAETVVRFAIKADYPEGPSQPGLFSELQPSLATIIQRMDQAAEDKSVAAVLLRIDDLEMGGGKLNELRAAVGRIRKAGKPVYAELTDADTGQYLLAVACDEIYMPPSGALIVPGIHAELTFYKGLLDKLGLKFDALQMGKYKGAAEPLTRNGMSPAFRENMEALVDDSYEAMVALIAKERHLKDYVVKTYLDQGLFSASAAKQAGLIDRVCYADQFEESLSKKLKVDRVDVVANYKKKSADTDFSGVGGLMKLLELFAGAKPAQKATADKRIAVVYAVGEIVQGKSAGDMFGNSSLGSTTLIEALHKASEDPKVVAVVLRIDSPGGSATASDLIWRETVRIKKPLIASMGDVAGSGGYYIAMSARTIIAEPGTITGSIGVIGGKLVTGGLYDKAGLHTEVISRGKNSGAMSANQPFTAEERKAWTVLLEETYGQFVSKAAEGRKMDRKKLEELAQGRVYSGRMAKKNGLVDELGTLQDAIVAAKKAAGLKPDAEVEILVLPQPKSVFEQLFGDAQVSSDMDSLMPDLFHLVRQAKVWRKLLGEKTLLWMPYQIRLR